MNGYEIKFEGTLFINAINSEECETVLKEIVKEAGFFNVKAKAEESFNWVEYSTTHRIFENYEVNWKANK